MGLDIRVPVGLMFATMGALLAGYGWLGDGSIYERSLGININLIWGLVLLGAAACLLALARWRRPPSGAPAK
jgi:hypothetical protein